MDEVKDPKGTVLIVDDDPNVLFFITMLCQPFSYTTLTAASGLEGLKIVQECGEKIDLILLDLNMPGMGGLEVLRSVRKHQPEMSVIVLSSMEDLREECEELGIEAFIAKPYILKDLSDTIQATVERKCDDKAEAKVDPEYKPAAKILIVDDEPQVCELLSESLGIDFLDAFFEIETALSGDEALKKSISFKPDIAIIDIKMPNMWGDELIRLFKAGHGHCPKDFVIYTSISNPQEVERVRKLGHRILSKPTNFDVLTGVLIKICVRHKLLRKI